MALDDVTARHEAEDRLRQSEEKLRQAQKMEALGQLVAGISHNFNNIMTITMAYTDLLLEQDDSLNYRAELEEIKKATSRGASLTRQLLMFSHRTEAAPKVIDLHGALTAMREFLAGAIREDIRLELLPSSTPATVLMDWSDFEHIVLNLVINAARRVAARRKCPHRHRSRVSSRRTTSSPIERSFRVITSSWPCRTMASA